MKTAGNMKTEKAAENQAEPDEGRTVEELKAQLDDIKQRLADTYDERRRELIDQFNEDEKEHWATFEAEQLEALEAEYQAERDERWKALQEELEELHREIFDEN